jgi:hypothetical protein
VLPGVAGPGSVGAPGVPGLDIPEPTRPKERAQRSLSKLLISFAFLVRLAGFEPTTPRFVAGGPEWQIICTIQANQQQL